MAELNRYRGYLVNSACFSFGIICAGLGAAISLKDANDKLYNRFRWILGTTATSSALLTTYFFYKVNELDYKSKMAKFQQQQS